MNLTSILAASSPQVIFGILGFALVLFGGYLLWLFIDETCYNTRPPLSQQYGQKAVYTFLGVASASVAVGILFLGFSGVF